MEQGIIALFAALLLFLAVQFAKNQKKNKEDFLRRAKESFGKVPEREYSVEELERISHYFKNYRGRAEFYLDDLTWEDLGMEDIFLLANQTFSSVGEDYLYWLFRTPTEDKKVLFERHRLITFFQTHEKERLKLQYIYHQLGRMRKHSVSDYLLRLIDLPEQNNRKHYIVIAAELISLVLLFVNGALGVFCFLACAGYGIVSYYREKGKTEPYFVCVEQAARMLHLTNELADTGIEELKGYFDELKRLKKECMGIVRGAKFICAGGASGSIGNVILDYVRMLTHIDLIQFNRVQKEIKEKEPEICMMFEIFGFLESMIAAASFRELLGVYCIPEFCETDTEENGSLSITGMYHPMLERPVANDIRIGKGEKRGILITGSNASGKSTFLKTVGICQTLAQTIMTVPAEGYQASFFRLYSSMAVRDSIRRGESYYLAEIRAIKRILDAKKRGEPVLCLVDEVLRGTNTVERIAASAQILKELGALRCLAATHDIELTYILESLYANFHFEEEISDGDIRFDYCIREGRAVTRNAIRLLTLLGYPEELTRSAERAAEEFMEKGEWGCL